MAIYQEHVNTWYEWIPSEDMILSTKDSYRRTTEDWDFRMQEQNTDFLVLENSPND